MRCTTGAGAGGGGAVLVLEKEKQPEPSVAAARTSPKDKNFIMQVPKEGLASQAPTVSCNDDREKCSCLRPPLQSCFDLSLVVSAIHLALIHFLTALMVGSPALMVGSDKSHTVRSCLTWRPSSAGLVWITVWTA